MTGDMAGDRVAQAAGAPAVLAAAYNAFELILQMLRGAEGRAGALLPAFAFAAAAAADGRDAVAQVPALPLLPELPGPPPAGLAPEEVADRAAALSRALEQHLTIATGAAGDAYREACTGGAAAATRIRSLLASQT